MVRSSLCTNSPSLRHGRPPSTLAGRLELTSSGRSSQLGKLLCLIKLTERANILPN